MNFTRVGHCKATGIYGSEFHPRGSYCSIIASFAQKGIEFIVMKMLYCIRAEFQWRRTELSGGVFAIKYKAQSTCTQGPPTSVLLAVRFLLSVFSTNGQRNGSAEIAGKLSCLHVNNRLCACN